SGVAAHPKWSNIPVEPPVFVSQLFDRADHRFQQRIHSSLLSLLETKATTASSNAAFFLITAVGLTGAAIAKYRLRQFANLCTFKPRKDLPVHLQLLRVLAGFSLDAKDLSIFERDLVEPPYLALCYRALYSSNLDNAIKFLPPIIQVAAASP